MIPTVEVESMPYKPPETVLALTFSGDELARIVMCVPAPVHIRGRRILKKLDIKFAPRWRGRRK